MKVTGKSNFPAASSGKTPSDADLRPTTRNRSLTRGKRVRRRSRPETPLLKWKVEDKERKKEKSEGIEDDDDEEGGRRGRRRKEASVVSARKLVAGLWRLQLPEKVPVGGGERKLNQLGFQPDKVYPGIPFLHNHKDKLYRSEENDALQSPSSVSRPKNGLLCKVEPSMQFSNSAMEGVTKWDPICLKTTDEVRQIYSQMKRIDQQVSAVSIVSSLESELTMARARIEELETERRSSKKKLEHFLRKVSEERTAWRSREREKMQSLIDDVKSDLNREKKNCKRLEIVNAKLVNELAEVKQSAKRYMQDFEKERKARELIEEVCDEIAKEMSEDKSEAEALKRDSMKLREEVDEERKMLQMAEVWREERVQMKLVDAKVALHEKYSYMNKLVAELETFLTSRGVCIDVKDLREAELLKEAAASVNVEEVKGFTYEPPNSDDIYSIFEDVNFAEGNEKETEQNSAYSPDSHASKAHRVSPEVNVVKKVRYVRHSDEIEDDESGWETVSHIEDQGSSFSPESVNKNNRGSNASGSGTEWEEDEISEVCSMPAQQLKKDQSFARLSNGRKSNVSIVESPDRGSGKGELSPMDLLQEWSSPESGRHRGMKGCIEWPRVVQKNSLKARLLEARMESQKVQLRHVLNQKI